eukprot:COSAG02_NODE_4350_length_5463_cov_2.614840_8_plen_233_part_00
MGLFRTLSRTALYGSAAGVGFAATLRLTQPAKYDTVARSASDLAQRAESAVHTVRNSDPQREAAEAFQQAGNEVQKAVQWQSVVLSTMVTSSLDAAQKSLAKQAVHAQTIAEQTAAEVLPTDAVLGTTRVEVHALLPDGHNYAGTALKEALSLDKDCVPDGFGKMLFTSGDVYVGDFRGGLMHGRGRWEAATGEQYIGEYVNGKREGEGRLVDATGCIVKQGRWSGGEFCAD